MSYGFFGFHPQVHQERRERERFIIKGGKGSGWFGPPKGTHVGRYTKRGKGKLATSFDAMTKMQLLENKLSDRLSELRVGYRSLKPKYRKKRQAEMRQIREKLRVLQQRKKALRIKREEETPKRVRGKGKGPLARAVESESARYIKGAMPKEALRRKLISEILEGFRDLDEARDYAKTLKETGNVLFTARGMEVNAALLTDAIKERVKDIKAKKGKS